MDQEPLEKIDLAKALDDVMMFQPRFKNVTAKKEIDPELPGDDEGSDGGLARDEDEKCSYRVHGS